ncbi:NADH dehydrogenase [ubiquinone] 1 alpha subcomplex subunit 9, mitochondrial isoform X2 [Orussus abietinus]|uniref:NADH dehydrogenase [ubiquinone] 1 alpha subcomplex subunit 9, mitochondrial isoform X2 n=1 Tax=Orussus abietinus TaxID=222816 RepID=UPI0006263A47|nr:NADH dehydrogenase [ubiquinone] 1 alpha subcomplex subunit 9, mitochondrial isoform X2 [Orussus abietinus]
MAQIQKYSLRLAQKQTLLASSAATQTCNYSSNPRIIKDSNTAALKRGTGGRSSFNGSVCTVFGASGFLGRYVCNQLGKIGTQLIIPFRGDHYNVMQLKLCGDLGQVLYSPFHLCDEESILKAIKYSNVVVNLIGCDWETKNFKFNDVNVEGPARLARLAKQSGVERFIHVSCLNVTANEPPKFLKTGSRFLKSKLAGEEAVKKEFPEATIVRPSDIYGQEDKFLRQYGTKFRVHLRGIPLWEKGEKTEKQPVAVYDVAAGIAALVKDPNTAGKTYQFVGPKRYKLSELVDWFCGFLRYESKKYGYRRLDIKRFPLFYLKLELCSALSPSYPAGLLHWEGIEKEHISDVVLKDLPTLEDLGIQLTEMENQVPWEMKIYKIDGTYDADLGEFDPPPFPKTVPLPY